MHPPRPSIHTSFFLVEGSPEVRYGGHFRAAVGGAVGCCTGDAIPPVLGSIDGGRTDVEDGCVLNTDACVVKVVEVSIDPAARGLDGDVDGFVAEDVLFNDDSGDGSKGVDVDAGGAGGKCVVGI